MKTCPLCASTTFDDMAICYGCLRSLDSVAQKPAYYTELLELPDELMIEEPFEEGFR